MKKYFVQADIHGFYTLWMDALKANGFDKNNSEHILIILGDLLDRGREPKEIIEFIKEMGDRCILIRGNHEDLFETMISRGYPIDIDFHNGTYQSYVDLFNKERIITEDEYIESDLCKYVNSKMIDFYETNHYVFTHGFIPVLVDDEWNLSYDENWREKDESVYERYRWVNGMELGDISVKDMFKLNKKIVCGHWSTRYGHKVIEKKDETDYSIYYGKNVICLDGTTVLTNKVNILVLNEDEL